MSKDKLSDKWPTWKELPLGATIIKPGNAVEYQTGEWRSMRPVTDEDVCITCGVCWLFCPDNSRRLVRRQKRHPGTPYVHYYDFDYRYCKGCAICVRECPTGAIVMVEEEG